MADNEQLEEILQGDTKIAMPFDLTINNDCYKCSEILRLLPGKRLVVKAENKGQQLVIKLFVKRKKGERELAREKRGYQLATQAGINVPDLVFATDNMRDYCAIAYRYLKNAKPFSNKKKTLSIHVDELLHLTATLHNFGIVQNDFHLGNILLVKDDLYLIDLASVTGQEKGKPLDKAASLANLAVLVVQFKPKQQQIMVDRLQQYYRARNWSFDDNEITLFKQYIEKAWQKRKTNYLSKRFRSCTMTAYKKTFSQEYAFRRTFLENVADEFINKIDELVSNGQILKAGNSATVVQVEYAGKKLVIKRYNIKSFWHLLRRCYRPSRAAVSWRNGNLLQLLGVPSPKPLGFIENRIGFFRKNAYLVCERSDGQELSTVYKYRPPTEEELAQLKYIFKILKKYQISHGDLKATNLLIKKKGKIQLIDLDGMREHTNQNEFQNAFVKDKHRFLKNWSDAEIKDDFEKLWAQI
ncbi:MAG: lipopolysaccharide kinase InaA family protein [Methylophagaceae bacterium]